MSIHIFQIQSNKTIILRFDNPEKLLLRVQVKTDSPTNALVLSHENLVHFKAQVAFDPKAASFNDVEHSFILTVEKGPWHLAIVSQQRQTVHGAYLVQGTHTDKYTSMYASPLA